MVQQILNPSPVPGNTISYDSAKQEIQQADLTEASKKRCIEEIEKYKADGTQITKEMVAKLIRKASDFMKQTEIIYDIFMQWPMSEKLMNLYIEERKPKE